MVSQRSRHDCRIRQQQDLNMPSYDRVLGQKVAAHLSTLGIETPFNKEHEPAVTEFDKADLQGSVIISHRQIMHDLGLDLQDDSLKDTPKRVAKMYCEEIFTGLDYNKFPACTTFENRMATDELLIEKNIDVLSVCEHHFVPFIGKSQVGYIPKDKLVGLSKLNRVVDFFSRRPQVQERLTLQIYHALQFILGTDDVAVTIEASHMCIRLRGVQQDGSTTVTSKMGGRFMSKPELRQEFMSLVK